MMFRDPKTGQFYDLDMDSPEQLAEAKRIGLVYACMHYLPEVTGEDPVALKDTQDFWKQAFGIDVLPKDGEISLDDAKEIGG